MLHLSSHSFSQAKRIFSIGMEMAKLIGTDNDWIGTDRSITISWWLQRMANKSWPLVTALESEVCHLPQRHNRLQGRARMVTLMWYWYHHHPPLSERKSHMPQGSAWAERIMVWPKSSCCSPCTWGGHVRSKPYVRFMNAFGEAPAESEQASHG